ncbi:MAG: methyltransferase [Parashewanella sp.]
MLSNSSQVIARNLELFEGQKVLLLNHEADALAAEIASNTSSITTLALDFNHFLTINAVSNTRMSNHFGHQLPRNDTFDTVIIYYPKAKPLAGYLFHLAAQYLAIGGQLLLVGENKGGIKSAPKTLPSFFDNTDKIDNARHCLLYRSELVELAPELTLRDWMTQYNVATPNGDIKICNLAGSFSQKQLDLGTQLLTENLATFTGRVLDFGCGAGVLTAALLKAQPELKVECVDINAMALASCELTLKQNDMTANVYPSDGFSDIEGQFDGVISNPPFHDGLKATTDITLNFVKSSATALTKGGTFQIVANRHLPYADIINAQFGSVNVSAENNKYKIYTQKA